MKIIFTLFTAMGISMAAIAAESSILQSLPGEYVRDEAKVESSLCPSQVTIAAAPNLGPDSFSIYSGESSVGNMSKLWDYQSYISDINKPGKQSGDYIDTTTLANNKIVMTNLQVSTNCLITEQFQIVDEELEYTSTMSGKKCNKNILATATCFFQKPQ